MKKLPDEADDLANNRDFRFPSSNGSNRNSVLVIIVAVGLPVFLLIAVVLGEYNIYLGLTFIIIAMALIPVAAALWKRESKLSFKHTFIQRDDSYKSLAKLSDEEKELLRGRIEGAQRRQMNLAIGKSSNICPRCGKAKAIHITGSKPSRNSSYFFRKYECKYCRFTQWIEEPLGGCGG